MASAAALSEGAAESARWVDTQGLFEPNSRYEPGTAASNLGGLAHPFQDPTFVQEVRGFVLEHAAEFAEGSVLLPQDGSQPLRWTELHIAFKALFEARLGHVLERERVGREELLSYAAELQEVCAALEEDDIIPASGGLKARGFRTFLSNLTASEDYFVFLGLMAAAARSCDAEHAAPDSGREDGAQEVWAQLSFGFVPPPRARG